jgi:hypothetical protein
VGIVDRRSLVGFGILSGVFGVDWNYEPGLDSSLITYISSN